MTNESRKAPATPKPAPDAVREALNARQRTVIEWGERCFGLDHMQDRIVRAARFFEEAAELVQSIGLPRDHALRAFNHVYSRVAGDPAQEAGGVANTLMALCGALGLSFDVCQQAEIERCLAKSPEHFAERNKAKLHEVDSAPAPSPDGAGESQGVLAAVRQEIVLAIAFLGRDSGSDRLQATVTSLIERLAKADALIRCAISQSATGAAEPGGVRPLTSLGVSQERLSEIVRAEPDLECGIATPPVRRDREAIKQLIRLHVGKAKRLAEDRIDWVDECADAILSLPVQPGAGERDG